MDYIKRLSVPFRQNIFKFIAGSHDPEIQRPNALGSSLLAKLPAELLLHIANVLPVSSAASFTLSCRQINHLVGTRYFEDLASSFDETLVFLNLIERDLQDYIVCKSCRKLHRIRDARKYTENGRQIWPVVTTPNCLADDRRTMVSQFLHDNFSTTVFKMVMKRHSLFGHDTRTRQLLRLLSWQIFPSHTWGTLVQSEKTECRINSGSLFTCKRVIVHGACKGVEQWQPWIWICPHLELKSTGPPGSLRIITKFPLAIKEMWSGLLHSKEVTDTKKTSWGSSSGFRQCRFCRTEFETTFEHHNGCKMKIKITIWKDLGQWPEGEEWKQKIYLSPLDRLSPPQSIQFPRGEITSVFEAQKVNLSWKENTILRFQRSLDSVMLELGLI
ncbi:uncharacterized protein RAG0_14948 [Rhynchosporium agropyri]|uniref:F-box domain-containing protein n=1 Tax=Rhynchosporium agropyri TaxID=914238 RepID=A0A1E1LJ15_9HELO|nr:uncharacterized protein RAG0_14948 [Rhynchosporium agropyri]